MMQHNTTYFLPVQNVYWAREYSATMYCASRQHTTGELQVDRRILRTRSRDMILHRQLRGLEYNRLR